MTIKQYNNKTIRIVFWGTPEFGAIILDSLIKNNYKPIAVVSAPDKPIGRKQILTPPPVKKVALKHNIPVFQPENLKTYKLKNLKTYKPDIFVVAAYGLILPREILDIPKFGSLNIHPSLLPKYRGASPIQATILNGDTETGITIILMDEKMDHGPIVAQQRLEFSIFNFQFSKLNEELAKLGAELLIKTLPKWINGEIKPIPQDHTKATFTKIIKKEDGHINWQNSAQYIERQVRAFAPWPGTYTYINFQSPTSNSQISKSKILKIIKASVLETSNQKATGEVFLTEDKKLAVACGSGALILEEVQIEGKRQMTGRDFLNGYPWIIGTILN